MEVFRAGWGVVGEDGLSDGHGTELCISALALSTDITFTVCLMVGDGRKLQLYYMQEFSKAHPFGKVVSTLATGPNTCAIINHGNHYWPWRGLRFEDILQSVVRCSPPKAAEMPPSSKKRTRRMKEKYDPEADALRPQWGGAATSAVQTAGIGLFCHVSEMAVNDPSSGVAAIKLLPSSRPSAGSFVTHTLSVTDGNGCGTEVEVAAPEGARASFSRPSAPALKVKISESALRAPVPGEPLRDLRGMPGSHSAAECAVSCSVSASNFLGFCAASGTVWLSSEDMSKRANANTPGSRGCYVKGNLVSNGELAIRLRVPFSSHMRGVKVLAGDCDRRLVRDLVTALSQFSGQGPLVLLSKFKRQGGSWGFSMDAAQLPSV